MVTDTATPVSRSSRRVVAFDGFVVLDHLDFSLREGELRFLIGPNGAGKTTLMDVLSGKVRPIPAACVCLRAEATRRPTPSM